MTERHDMKRVLVIGCPGSGKSTFARALQSATGLPLYYLDMLNWNADKTTVDRQVFIDRLNKILPCDEWIIDGNYSFTLGMRLEYCDTVFLLDYPTEVCLAGVAARRGKSRPDMPWIEEQDDEEFLDFIRSFASDRLPQIKELLGNHPEKRVIIFNTREQSENYLDKLS